MKIILFFSLIIFILGCSGNHDHSLSVTNHSKVNFDSIKIASDVGQIRMKGLAVGQTAVDVFKVMKESSSGGAFSIELYTKDSVVEKQFGYFGNSGDIPDKLDIVVGLNFKIYYNEKK